MWLQHKPILPDFRLDSWLIDWTTRPNLPQNICWLFIIALLKIDGVHVVVYIVSIHNCNAITHLVTGRLIGWVSACVVCLPFAYEPSD